MDDTRRTFLKQTGTGFAVLVGLAIFGKTGGLFMRNAMASTGVSTPFEVTKTPAEWRKILTPEQYNVLREQGTEAPFTSPLNSEHRTGTFTCAGCALPLFTSAKKYDSGTGWPSFWEPLPAATATQTDIKMIIPRTEVHCRRCGGHLGHVFNDGPAPTGKRYCMNGVAMSFQPQAI